MATTDPDKKAMQERQFATMKTCIGELEAAVKGGKQEEVDAAKKQLLAEGKDLISDWLDSSLASSVTDNSIFESLPRYWEGEFHKDMQDLNVLPADCLTRVSEYVPEIVVYIEKIIERGYAYESNGSVYFDVGKFDSKPSLRQAGPGGCGRRQGSGGGRGRLECRGFREESRESFCSVEKIEAGGAELEKPL